MSLGNANSVVQNISDWSFHFDIETKAITELLCKFKCIFGSESLENKSG